ncbi:MAG: hypothetical protein HA495_03600 [Thaumarchaeota archaeon]|nr:hypothetical protein [Nitrososphaerota archaeon]
MLKTEVESGGDNTIESSLKSIEEELEQRAEKLERELNYTVIPLDKLVKIQLAAGLYTALYVQVKNA